MQRQLAECRTCLDIGCGGNSPVRFIGFEHAVGIDGYEPALAEARRNGTHDEHLICDAREIGKRFSPRQFDCCVALDLIEHLPKEDGFRLIESMQRIASKKILLFTPNGFLPQESVDGDLQAHRSGWEPGEMRSLGFHVIGMHGAKWMRGEQHRPRFRPRPVAGLLSLATHILYARRNPDGAAALLCVKDVDKMNSRERKEQ
jgi:hypothetical protein